ncbi:hypothetical protein F3J22_28600 [Chitinophaga sp. Cy-1792]|nr:hypothetical protein [Chitinophaga sp. Cy-1792]
MLSQIPSYAGTIKVSTLADLQQAISKARPGDEIILADGNYTTDNDITINCSGSEKNHIIIRANTTGGAVISGNGGFQLIAPAQYVDISNFKFAHKASHTKTAPGTSWCQFTHNIFEETGDGEYLLLAGNNHRISYNTFQHKNSMGRFIAVRGQGSQIAENLQIDHNYFYDFKPQTGNGAEALQFGLSGFSMSGSNSVVEYNLFEECAGENELISVKSSDVILRYNTVRNCKAQFTLRHGNYCQVYSNYFTNTPGLRIFGDHHLIHDNYFTDCDMGINIGNGDGEVATGSLLTCHDRPDSILITANIMVCCKHPIIMTERKDGLGATAVTIIKNQLYDCPEAASIKGPFPGAKWQNNQLTQVSSRGDMPEDDNSNGTRVSAVFIHVAESKKTTGTNKSNPDKATKDTNGNSPISVVEIGNGKTRFSATALTSTQVGANAK